MKQPLCDGRLGAMNPEVVKLMADLERYRKLRHSVIDTQTQEGLDQLIRETEERLWQLENAEQC
jgi:post-segregation antitoxin (ccd killing protein)